jgi:hypothetical protein
MRRLLTAALVLGLLWPLYALVSVVLPAPLPREFGRLPVVYSSQETFGFGPGGNETMIVVHRLPADLAASVAAGGVAYLSGLDTSAHPVSGWAETPVVLDERWRPDEGSLVDPHDPPGIGGFLFRNGWPIPLDKTVEADVNAALFAPGSYIGYGRGSLMLVSPARGIVVFAYRK